MKDCVNARKDVNNKRTDEDIEKETDIHLKISKDPHMSKYIIKMFDVVKDRKYVYLILEYASRVGSQSCLHLASKIASSSPCFRVAARPQRRGK